MHERITRSTYVPDVKALTRKKRVCAYARVSSDKDEAFHSLSAQISYYQQKIADHPDWEFVEVFSDQGITGTKETRPGFQAMLTACREHKVDIVLAKSITRFARNTVILLETVRELRGLGIDIHFEEERIETLSAKGEFMIALLAARAQEESRSASENQKWRIQKAYQKGIPVTGNCLGYRMVDHQFLIEEEEEQTVLKIFSLYLSGMGCAAIAKQLMRDGAKTKSGETNWSRSAVRRILGNEKYQGDLILQKSYVTDHISKKEVVNRGERPQYVVRDAHDAIIDRETFGETQTEIGRRVDAYANNEAKDTYPFSGMIVCGKCGSHYKHKFNGYSKYRKAVWTCNRFDVFSTFGCDAQMIPADILTEKTCEVLGISEFDDNILKERVDKIVIPEKYMLVFYLKDGTERRVAWQHKSRRESWTPEMKEAARQRTLAQNEARRNRGKENGT